MLKNKLIIGLIPAKIKSVGLKNKNLKRINGKSLTEIAIMNAVKSKYLDKVYVTTNSNKISLLSKKYKTSLIKRPESLCNNTAGSEKVITHFIKNLKQSENKLDTIIVYLQPTSPLRDFKDIDKAIKVFLSAKNNSLISVSKLDSKFLKTVELKKGTLYEANQNLLTKNRQELDKFYYLDGFIFIFTIKKFLKSKNFLNKSTPFYTSTEKSIDVDDLKTFNLAKRIMEKKNEDCK
jgi:CMP-N-acetylneuraminic acid synthetase